MGSLTKIYYLCVCAPSHALPHEQVAWRGRVVLPPLMPRLTGRCSACALHVRALLVLLHLIASELCVLSAACLLFVATGDFTTTSSREASPPAWAPSQRLVTCACVLPRTGSLTICRVACACCAASPDASLDGSWCCLCASCACAACVAAPQWF